MQAYNLFQVLEYGPIVAWDESSGTIITCSKSAFSAWTSIGPDMFVGNNTCLVTDLEKVGDCTDFGLVCEVANEWLKVILNDSEPDEPSN